MNIVETIPLHETARARYLNYALSVITSRALPDIRDGLKPVQRRILYAMYTNLRLTPDARHRKSATIVGECFVAGTLVTTPHGLVPIEQLEVGDEVVTQTGTRRVTQTYVMPPQLLLRITLRDGRTTTCTPGQAFKVLTPELDVAWRDARDLRPGDAVLLKVGRPHGVSAQTVSGVPLNADVAYLLGFFLADGWVDRDRRGYHRLAFGSADVEILDRLSAILLRQFGYTARITQRREGFYFLRVSQQAVNRRILDAFGLHDKYADTIAVPNAILKASPDVQMAFLSGFVDGDGSVHKSRALLVVNTIQRPFLAQVQVLLHAHGIHSRLLPYHRTGERPEWALEVAGASLQRLAPRLRLSHPLKRARLEAIRRGAVPKAVPKVETAEAIPYLGPLLIQEFRARHRGGGWYEAPGGEKVRMGLRYAGGTKVRYAADLAETFRASFPALRATGALRKMEAIGSRYLDRINTWREQGVTFGQVRSVEAVAPAITFDVQVEADHEFVAEGMLVHNCMGKYHPHGDTAIYDAMVRMAQPFSLRAPLVDGQGNFGSIDGDSPAAMRYTEVRLQPLGAELLSEIRKNTVPFRPTYDGQLFEPVVLPAPLPNLLVNGATGIAVGMATNIPPHNLGEVVDACILLIGSPNARMDTLMKHVLGPDFPTGGCILNTPEELRAIYEKGEGAVDLRGEYTVEGRKAVVVTSIPYGLTKGDLIEKIADHIRLGRVPQLLDIRDESTDDVRIVLELKRGADPAAAMAYLFKHTPLQTRFHVNLTCLVPTHNPEVAAPEKVDLRTALQAFLDFRMETVTRRLRHDLEQLEKRIHILRGFALIFGALDEAIKLIRASRDKADAGQRLRHRFGLDELQADAILEIKLYRLARMEIDAILKELAEKEQQAAALRALLADEQARWSLIRTELREIRRRYADARRTAISGPDEVLEYSAEDYIIAEDVYAIVTRDGWVKRQRSYTTLDAIRVREGDAVAYAVATSTRATLAFFTSAGKAYTLRVDDLPPTTGYGDPIQKLFDFADREHVVGVVPLDRRILPDPIPASADPELFAGDGAPPEGTLIGPFVVGVASDGLAVRMTLDLFSEPSNKNGRTYVRVAKGQQVVAAALAAGDENVCLASKEGRALIFPVAQLPVFKSAAKGVIAMRLQGPGDRVLGMAITTAARDGLEVETSRGRREVVRTTKFEVTSRGGRGRAIIQRGTLRSARPEPVEIHLNGRE